MRQGNAAVPQIWLAPLDPIVRPFNHTQGPSDFFELFLPSAPWSVTAAHVNVFKLYPQLIALGSEADLSRAFQDLRRRGIAVALEFGAMTDTAVCGRGVEGYNGGQLHLVAQKIRRLGGELTYLAMDEPLWYGAHFTGNNGCHSTIDTIARDVGANIKALRDVFPDIHVGDIEPVPQNDISSWSSEVLQWTKAFERETGKKLAFFHVDVLWRRSWEPWINALHAHLSASGIPFGVIYNGNMGDNSDAAWLAHAAEHFQEFEDYNGRPDQVIFQSWMNYPTQILPEHDPKTLSSLVLTYLKFIGGL